MQPTSAEVEMLSQDLPPGVQEADLDAGTRFLMALTKVPLVSQRLEAWLFYETAGPSVTFPPFVGRVVAPASRLSQCSCVPHLAGVCRSRMSARRLVQVSCWRRWSTT